MLSRPEVQALTEEFVCVKIDPRETQEGMENKRSRYVPEIVLLDSRQNFITAVDRTQYAPEAFMEVLRAALEENKR